MKSNLQFLRYEDKTNLLYLNTAKPINMIPLPFFRKLKQHFNLNKLTIEIKPFLDIRMTLTKTTWLAILKDELIGLFKYSTYTTLFF